MFNNDENSDISTEKKIKSEVLFKVPSFDDNESLFLNYSEVFKLAQVIHESLFIKYPALKQLF